MHRFKRKYFAGLILLSVVSAPVALARDRVVSKVTKTHEVSVPVSPSTLSCSFWFDDYKVLFSTTTLNWDYSDYVSIKTGWNSSLSLTIQGHCPSLEGIYQQGAIHQRLTATLTEVIGERWGGCKRFQEETVSLRTLPKYKGEPYADLEVTSFNYQVLEELPIKECRKVDWPW